MSAALVFHPLTEDRWGDLVELFGKRGAYGGCWCMWWRSTRAEFEKRQGTGNRRALQRLVKSGEVTGILAYADGRPVGWCSVAPRDNFGSLNRSPVLKPLDQRPVWSIVCFFIYRHYRRKGVMLELIRAAVRYVREQGGEIVEAYPTQRRSDRVPPFSAFMGFPGVFAEAGFEECARPSKSRVIMRCYLNR